jgi:hypothetical protein
MRKFVIRCVKDVFSIVEVVYEVMPKHYDYALKEGEWKGKITAPTFMYEKDVNNNLVPPIWCWWAFHDSQYAAMTHLESSFKDSIIRNGQKKARLAGIVYEPLSAEELYTQVNEALSKVKVILL